MMDYIWIILAALSAILIALYSKKVDKAEHPSAYVSKKKKKKKVKAQKPLRENRMLELSMVGLFLGIVASSYFTEKMALCLSVGFFAGLVLGMIFKKKTYVESLDELEIEEEPEKVEAVKFSEAEAEAVADEALDEITV